MQARRSRDLRRTHQTQKHAKSRARQCVQSIGRIVLCLCFLAAVYAARPGFAQTAPAAPSCADTASDNVDDQPARATCTAARRGVVARPRNNAFHTPDNA